VLFDYFFLPPIAQMTDKFVSLLPVMFLSDKFSFTALNLTIILCVCVLLSIYLIQILFQINVVYFNAIQYLWDAA